MPPPTVLECVTNINKKQKLYKEVIFLILLFHFNEILLTYLFFSFPPFTVSLQLGYKSRI